MRRIRKGTRVIEYVGDRVSHDEADRRYEHRPLEDNHTFLFIVDGRTVIDAGVGGNAARFINHGCDPNCETVIEKRRVFIEAVRTVQPGEELFYDYQIKRDRGDPKNIDEIFACRCGAASCRGSMLERRKAVQARRQSPRRSPRRVQPQGNARTPGGRAERQTSRRAQKKPADRTPGKKR